MPSTAINVRHIVVVGDGAVGKTWLLHRFHNDEPPSEYLATVYDRSEFEMIVDDEPCTVMLHDTAGQEAYDRLRRVVYPMADAFLLCYNVDNRSSFVNATVKWVNELNGAVLDVPIVLCATKIDLRSENPSSCVTSAEGEMAAKEMRANAFIECSAKTNISVREAVVEAVKASIVGKPNVSEEYQNRSCCCCHFFKSFRIKLR